MTEPSGTVRAEVRRPLLASRWSSPVAVTLLAACSVRGWRVIWFLDGEYGPAGTDDWTMSEAWQGPLAIPIAIGFTIMWAAVLALWICVVRNLPGPVAPLTRTIMILSAPPAAIFAVMIVLMFALVHQLIQTLPLWHCLSPYGWAGHSSPRARTITECYGEI